MGTCIGFYLNDFKRSAGVPNLELVDKYITCMECISCIKCLCVSNARGLVVLMYLDRVDESAVIIAFLVSIGEVFPTELCIEICL